MPACPTCGSTSAPCACEIAAWVDGPSDPSTAVDRACTACRYSGEMPDLGLGTICPACGVVMAAGRADSPLRVTQLIACPECGHRIGVTAEDRGKTVVCPGCSCFLGTPASK